MVIVVAAAAGDAGVAGGGGGPRGRAGRTGTPPAAVGARLWFGPLLQSEISTLVPAAVWLSKTSRHRLDEAPRSSVVPPTLLPLPAASRYITTPCPGTVALIPPVVVVTTFDH